MSPNKSPEPALDPSFEFVATSDGIDSYCLIDENCNIAQLRNFTDMLKVLFYNNELLYGQVMFTLESMEHPHKNIILSMMPPGPEKEPPMISPLQAWK